jgi:hypothetical protein
MEPVIIALAEAIWPPLELQAAEQSTGDAAALAHYFRLSGAEMKQVPQEVRAGRNACASLLLCHAATAALACICSEAMGHVE